MNNSLIREMMSYYDERAREYDEVYEGRGPAVRSPAVYGKDVKEISRMISAFGGERLIDIGCGTGFWLPFYARNCSSVTLVDQSSKMLLECKSRIETLGVEERCRLIQGDFFEVDIAESSFDSACVGFFVSHLSPELERRFFGKLKRILSVGGSVMVVDSVWNETLRGERARRGAQKRRLNDGRTFSIYKRYFDMDDIETMFEQYRIELMDCYVGKAFFAATGRSLK
jgi:demethylmenaquinone methyltransferase/2-methoxy-6-polyprenyl-1,4-benzoquinol methylase